MNEIMEKLSEYLEAAEGLVTEYAPEAAALVLHVVQLEAIFYLLMGTVAVLSIYPLVRICIYCAKQVEDAPVEPPYIIASIATGTGAFVMMIVSITTLLSFYNWLAAFNPLAGLVYKLIN